MQTRTLTQTLTQTRTQTRTRTLTQTRTRSVTMLPFVEVDSLVERARAGDRAALEQLLARVAPSIHRFGLRMCKNPSDAEDVLQDTLIAVASHLGEFEGRSSLSSWVFALTRSACAHRRRGLKNKPLMSDDAVAEQPDVAPTPEALTADHELGAALSLAIGALQDDYREVILLRDVEGLSAPDTAATLDITVDAVKSRLHRAREALRTQLRPLLEPTERAAAAGCPDVVAMWSKKLEGDLSQADCAVMEHHVAGCPSCGAACDALKKALLACKAVESEAVPPEVQHRVKAAMRAWSPTPAK
jgi:RNA polymerase sigma-70 factor (ECF subfamily)